MKPRRSAICLAALSGAALVAGCCSPASNLGEGPDRAEAPASVDDPTGQPAQPRDGIGTADASGGGSASAATGGERPPAAGTFEVRQSRPDLLGPTDLVYQGAFRLPEGSNGSTWDWSSAAFTYDPDGDGGGPDDGYPGSLFGFGHDHQSMVSEIDIPPPVIPSGDDLRPLNRAKTLQPFTDIRRGRIPTELEIPLFGLEYLTGPEGQRPGVLHYCFGQHFQEGERVPSHGWVARDLSDARIIGPWRVGRFENYSTNNYLFEIPRDWAERHVDGMRLATGRYREGGQSSRGPVVIAYDPYNRGKALARGERLPAKALLQYTSVNDGPSGTLDGYVHCDDWAGGAWLTAGDRSAVIFIGTKAVDDCWYGWADGTRHPNPENRDGEGDRGFWSNRYKAWMLFYDTEDLAAVARGRRRPHSPQPSATLDLDPFLHAPRGPQQQFRVRAVAYDRQRGYVYVVQFLADDDRSMVHVFRLR